MPVQEQEQVQEQVLLLLLQAQVPPQSVLQLPVLLRRLLLH